MLTIASQPSDLRPITWDTEVIIGVMVVRSAVLNAVEFLMVKK
jgi:hypothetical protein